jgi:cyclopropane fatty-acyl-phospholipid synthase-like methyltransferase
LVQNDDMNDKPFSEYSERNRDPILAVLRDHFSARKRVLEIGSGTGQHAVYFAHELPNVVWQASDRAENLPGIRAWIDDAALTNTPPPIELDAAVGPWPAARFDAFFSANTLHIMAWSEVQAFFRALPDVAQADAKLAIYGPFNYGGKYTSASNEGFDRSLKNRGAHMGIRDFEAVDTLAKASGFQLVEDVAMPANNRCIVWQRSI